MKFIILLSLFIFFSCNSIKYTVYEDNSMSYREKEGFLTKEEKKVFVILIPRANENHKVNIFTEDIVFLKDENYRSSYHFPGAITIQRSHVESPLKIQINNLLYEVPEEKFYNKRFLCIESVQDSITLKYLKNEYRFDYGNVPHKYIR